MSEAQIITMIGLLSVVNDARVNRHFAVPPYHVETFPIGSGVFNANGFNCLEFESYPGAGFTSLQAAQMIAEKWNAEAGR